MTPALSVVVVILGGGWECLARCLRGLAAQLSVSPPEIPVAHDESLTGVPALRAEFPAVEFLGAPGRKTYAELRAIGFCRDMVVGARIGKRVKIPWGRRPAKWFLHRLASYLAGQRLPDINSGLRVMRKDLVERYLHLLPSGFSLTTTITLAAACNDHQVEYVPIDYHPRRGPSKVRPRHASLKVFIPLGAVLALAGLAKFVYDITLDNLSESAVLALLGALIVWSVGLLADQNARIAMHR